MKNFFKNMYECLFKVYFKEIINIFGVSYVIRVKKSCITGEYYFEMYSPAVNVWFRYSNQRFSKLVDALEAAKKIKDNLDNEGK